MHLFCSKMASGLLAIAVTTMSTIFGEEYSPPAVPDSLSLEDLYTGLFNDGTASARRALPLLEREEAPEYVRRRLRLCDTKEERECFNPIRDGCREKYPDQCRDVGCEFRKCLGAGRKQCRCTDESGLYPDLDEGDEFFELVEVVLDGLCRKDLEHDDNVEKFETAILNFSNDDAKCRDLGVKFESFTLVDLEEGEDCGSGNRRFYGRKLPRKKMSKAKGQRKGDVCRGCTKGHRRLKSSKCRADLVDELNEFGFEDVTTATLEAKLQDCRSRSSDCFRGFACCGASDRCQCKRYDIEELKESMSYEY